MAVDVEKRWVTDDAIELTLEVRLKHVSISLGCGKIDRYTRQLEWICIVIRNKLFEDGETLIILQKADCRALGCLYPGQEVL